MGLLLESQENAEFLTGLLYVAPERMDFVLQQSMVETPLVELADDALRPSREVLASIMDGL